MIDFINGKLVDKTKNKIVVECNGIGFAIFFPLSNFSSLQDIGENVKIWTYMHVKEDEMSLYGFLTKDDRTMFLNLLTVNSVGPKGAMNLISTFGSLTLSKAIVAMDNKLIATVPGIGQKTASKICIELGDKLQKENFDKKIDIAKKEIDSSKISFVRNEAIEGLVKLGYQEKKAREILLKIPLTGDEDIGDVIKQVLVYKV